MKVIEWKINMDNERCVGSKLQEAPPILSNPLPSKCRHCLSGVQKERSRESYIVNTRRQRQPSLSPFLSPLFSSENGKCGERMRERETEGERK